LTKVGHGTKKTSVSFAEKELSYSGPKEIDPRRIASKGRTLGPKKKRNCREGKTQEELLKRGFAETLHRGQRKSKKAVRRRHAKRERAVKMGTPRAARRGMEAKTR